MTVFYKFVVVTFFRPQLKYNDMNASILKSISTNIPGFDVIINTSDEEILPVNFKSSRKNGRYVEISKQGLVLGSSKSKTYFFIFAKPPNSTF